MVGKATKRKQRPFHFLLILPGVEYKDPLIPQALPRPFSRNFQRTNSTIRQPRQIQRRLFVDLPAASPPALLQETAPDYDHGLPKDHLFR